MEIRPNVIALGGTTASGKTSLSLKLAKECDGEIINCDSRQIYKYLDIGTAKEKIDRRNKDDSVMIKGVKHHLIDFLDLTTKYTLAHFQKDAFRTIRTVSDKGSIPILVGGTGLYLDAVVFNYDLREQKIDRKQRSALERKSVKELQKILNDTSEYQFSSMNMSDQNNPRRLIRAIECAEQDQHKVPQKNTSEDTSRENRKFNTLYLVVDTPDDILNKKIHERTEKMFRNGLTKENKKLREMGYTTDLPSLQTIGYQEFDAYFENKQSLKETQELIELHTRQYAKRQRTWFKRNKEAHWIFDERAAVRLAQEFLATSL